MSSLTTVHNSSDALSATTMTTMTTTTLNNNDSTTTIEGDFVDDNTDEKKNNDIFSLSSLSSSSSPLLILPLIWGIAFLSSLDRVAMSVAILPLSEQYGYTDTIKGQVSSLFSIGYGLMIIPSGLIVASKSPSRVLFCGLILWSIGTILTPYAAYVSGTVLTDDTLIPLLVMRAAIGASEAVVLPSIQKLLINWIPSERKSISIATVFASFQAGTIGAYILSPKIIDMYDWEGLFYIYGLCGLLYSIPLLLFCKDSPSSPNTNTKNSEEQQQQLSIVACNGDDIRDCMVIEPSNDKITTTIISNDDVDNTASTMTATSTTTNTNTKNITDDAMATNIYKSAPWKSFVQSKAVWGMLIAHAANNVGMYINLSWTPTFYSEQYGLNVRDSAFLSVLPSVTGAICGLTAGTVADAILKKKNYNDDNSDSSQEEENDDDDNNNNNYENVRTNVRKIFQGIALYGPAITLFTMAYHIPDEPWVAQGLLMGTVGLQAFNAAGYGAANQEKAGPRWSGLLYSLTSLPGVLIGSLGVYMTGQILDVTQQDWTIVFALNAIINVIGATSFILLYDGKREFD